MDIVENTGLEALLTMAEGVAVARPTEDGVVRRRERNETEPCEHAYLGQTVPPRDPVVRAIERRRSGEG